MSAITPIQKAKSWAVYVDDQAYTMYGDRVSARKALARKYGWAENALRCLRYDRTKNLTIVFYDKLCEAFEDAAEHQIRKLKHDIAEARAGRKTLPESVVARAEDALKELAALKIEGGK